MSSATSTEGSDTKVGPSPSTVNGNGAAAASGLLPWQFFVLAALGCATAVNVMVRGQGLLTIILVTMMVGTTALVGIAALRTLNPLVTEDDDRTAVVGGRTRAALEREKVLALRAIKELEFDRAMGKVSDADFEEMAGRLRTRAARLIRQLDTGASYHEQIERDLAKRLGSSSAKAVAERESRAPASAQRYGGKVESSAKALAERPSERSCACGTINDVDARFCKACGAKL